LKMPDGRRGFTLTEIMISLALALILIIGINQVFSISATTISTGAGQLEMMRGHRAAFSTMRTDFEGFQSDASTGIVPTTETSFLLIHNEKRLAYRDQQDDDLDPNAIDTVDLNEDGVITPSVVVGPDTIWTGEDVSVATGNQYVYNRRNHRTDVIGFFSKGSFRRQTGQVPPGGGDEYFVTDQGSDRAYIWYGHLRVANNIGSGLPTLYHPAEADASATDRNDNNRYARQWALGRVVLPMIPKNPITARILDSNNVSQIYIDQEAGRSMSPFSWDSLVGSPPDTDARGTLQAAYFTSAGAQLAFYDLADAEISAHRAAVVGWSAGTWWQNVLYENLTGLPVGRFAADRYVGRPANSGHTSMTVPFFVDGCTQFFVEFAGDFVDQSATGTITNAAQGTDGIDFYVPSTGIRGIRWYGLQRDVDGNGISTAGTSPDVAPVQVFGATPRTFERSVTANEYSCVWGPVIGEFENPAAAAPHNRPILVRITIQVVDKNARVPDGLTQEYIFKVKP